MLTMTQSFGNRSSPSGVARVTTSCSMLFTCEASASRSLPAAAMAPTRVRFSSRQRPSAWPR